ncbi:hypothetical protein H9P43_003176 [Blastocladiella emersonii ATCC 22665]|nr:hypothetical protein H9P43_003176 [Blastocladiella emersonii ATCC 22665]
MSMQSAQPTYGYPAKEYPNITPASAGGLSSITETITAPISRATSGLASLAAPLTDTAAYWGRLGYDTFRVYWDAYPVLRAFTYAFGALTAIPNLIFLTYAAISFGIVATIATVGVLVVEGGILGFGMLFLGPILFFSFWGALIAVGLFTAAFYGLRASSITLSTAQSVTGDSGIVGGSVGLAKNALATTADLMEKAEAVVVGREGLPVPIAGRV